MPLQTHKILVIWGSEKKRALIFVEKCDRGGEIKKMWQKGTAKLWAPNQHLQKVVTLFSMIMKALDPKS